MYSSGYRPELDGLRGIAVLGVLLFHLNIGVFKGGYVGVDIFFVLSGFLITHLIMDNLRSGQFSLPRFYARRARRILPALLATVVISLMIGFLLFTPQHFERLARSSIYVSLAVPNLFFLSESGYFDVEAIYKPLLHTWTLGVEEQFYFVWPLILLLVYKLKQSLIPVTFVLLGMVSLSFSEVLLESNSNLSFYLMPFRAFEFCLGAVLIWMMRFQPNSRWIGELTFLAGLGLMVAPMIFFDEATPFPGVWALIPCVGAALVIYSGRELHVGFLLRNAILTGIGRISYSLYLVHWPFIVFYRYWNFGELDSEQRFVAFVGSLICATILYSLVEKPFRERRSEFVHPSPATVGFMGCFAVLICVVCASHIWAQGGWTWRVNNSLNSVSIPDARYDVVETMKVCKPLPRSFGVKPCGFGIEPTDTYDFLLMGDSHSQHFLYGLDQIFDEKRLSGIYVLSGHNNVPFKGGVLMTHGNPGKTNDKEYEFLQNIKYRNVILAARWHMYANTQSHDLKGRVYTWGEHNELTPESSLAAMEAGAIHTINYFQSLKKRVFVIGQVPPFGPDVNVCFNRPDYIIDFSRRGCGGLGRAEILKTAKRSDKLFEKLSVESGLTFINLTSKMCKEECISIIDDTYLYRDDDHINRFGSAVLAQNFLRSKFE